MTRLTRLAQCALVPVALLAAACSAGSKPPAAPAAIPAGVCASLHSIANDLYDVATDYSGADNLGLVQAGQIEQDGGQRQDGTEASQLAAIAAAKASGPASIARPLSVLAADDKALDTAVAAGSPGQVDQDAASLSSAADAVSGSC
jgi:hypothetical protein